MDYTAWVWRSRVTYSKFVLPGVALQYMENIGPDVFLVVIVPLLRCVGLLHVLRLRGVCHKLAPLSNSWWCIDVHNASVLRLQ